MKNRMLRIESFKPATKYLYLLPIFLIIGLVFIFPLAQTIYYSFFRIRMGAREGVFVGWENYLRLFGSADFQASIRSTLIWTFGNWIVQLTVPLGIALLLNLKLKGVHFMRAAYLIPWIIPMVAVAVSMRWMLLPGIGGVNEVLQNTIGTQINFLGSRSAAMPTLILLNSWKLFPFGVLLILAALQTIPDELYEAAQIDGASSWQRFIHITFPLLGKLIWFMGFLVFVWNFNAFDLIWLTTAGGPGHLMRTLPVWTYRAAFRTFRFGEASAVATIGIVVLIFIGLLYFKFLAPKGEDEVEVRT